MQLTRGGKLSLVARALEKHQDLIGAVAGNAAAKNQRGLQILAQLLSDPGSRVVTTPSGVISARVSIYAGEFVDIVGKGLVARFYLPAGQGINAIRFIGFRRP